MAQLKKDINQSDITKDGNGGTLSDNSSNQGATSSAALYNVYQSNAGVGEDSSDSGTLRFLTELARDREQERKREKASKAKSAVLAVGEALRNIANLSYTARGAIPQRYDNSMENYRRQSEKEKEAYNKKREEYLKFYYKQQQAQKEQARQRAKDLVALYQREREFNYNVAKDKDARDWREKQQNYTNEYRKQQIEEKKRAARVREKQAQQRIANAQHNAEARRSAKQVTLPTFDGTPLTRKYDLTNNEYNAVFQYGLTRGWFTEDDERRALGNSGNVFSGKASHGKGYKQIIYEKLNSPGNDALKDYLILRYGFKKNKLDIPDDGRGLYN